MKKINYVLNQEQTKKRLMNSVKANIPCLVTSQPGVGKSAIIKQIAEELKLKLIDIRLTQVSQYDLNGLPAIEEGKSYYAPMNLFPLKGSKIPEGYEGWLIFLDEFMSADKFTQAAAYKLLLDRQIGEHDLHENVRILMASNRSTDGALVTKMNTAIQSRITHVEMEADYKVFTQYVAKEVEKGNWHPLVYGFINFMPKYINNFDPAKEVTTYACPRTLEMLSKELKAGLLDLDYEIYMPAIAGIVGEAAATDFCSFYATYGQLPDYKDIIAKPATTPVPEQIAAKWALGAYLGEHIEEKDQDAVIEYVKRIEEDDLRVIIYRMIRSQAPYIGNNELLKEDLVGIVHRNKK